MMTRFFRRYTSVALAVAGLAVAPLSLMPTASLRAQQVITDEYGTEWLVDALPPDVQTQVIQTQESMTSGLDAQGPLEVTGAGRFVLNPEDTSGLSAEPLVDNLRGIVLVPRPGDVAVTGVPNVEGIWHDYEDFPVEVGNVLAQYIGQPVSLASLDQMIRDVIKAYRESGRPVVDVLLPEQDITSGVVQLVVVEADLGRIRVEGVDADTGEYLRSQVTLQEGEPIRSQQLLRDLNWLNKSPYRKVDLIYAPGYEFGTTDIILRVNESDPVFFYAGYENSGTELLGEDRLLFGANWGNALGPDRALSYQLTADTEFDKVIGHSLIYNGPLPWRHYLTLLGSYVDVNAEIPVADTFLAVGGENIQGSARYAMPVIWSPQDQSHELEFGFDFKSSNNNLQFGGDDVFDTTTEIFQFSLGYNILAHDSRGVTKVDITGFYSPGDWSALNSDEVFEQARGGASAEYAFANIRLERQHVLPEQWSLRAAAVGQVSNGNLLASEQLGAGGYDTVRGFEQRVARGDQGAWGTIEFYTPPMSIGRLMEWENETDTLRFLAFYDQAYLANVDLLEGEPGNFQLMSAGVGLRWNYSDWFRLRLDVGIPVGTDNLDGIDDDPRLHIGAYANF